MIYNKYSLIGYMLWLRYALLAGKPWRNLGDIYSHHLESPGTKAYTSNEARNLFKQFSELKISIVLTHGDLLESDAGQRHRGILLNNSQVCLATTPTSSVIARARFVYDG
jgi:hypothetical protein